MFQCPTSHVPIRPAIRITNFPPLFLILPHGLHIALSYLILPASPLSSASATSVYHLLCPTATEKNPDSENTPPSTSLFLSSPSTVTLTLALILTRTLSLLSAPSLLHPVYPSANTPARNSFLLSGTALYRNHTQPCRRPSSENPGPCHRLSTNPTNSLRSRPWCPFSANPRTTLLGPVLFHLIQSRSIFVSPALCSSACCACEI
ncbi:hypothetical protein BGZ61DRAFT_130598 [Ilyonectria robusta]|uniref:uncharacterized protein n=1 Tax=Ilyonectria robusta TaxID=1079257 RepID=UPI001E8CA08C|nr:uncharacterized protein BGZ61DRAFT_130598 [Ilyonectria robusta]KAH8734838.1 hypothetical protein BGZ61DRAFT_130598 [Ilyonectria robusta]